MMRKKKLLIVFCIILLLALSVAAGLIGYGLLRHERRQNSDIEQLQIKAWSIDETEKENSEEFRILQQKTEDAIRFFFLDKKLNAYQKLACGKNISLLIVGDSISALPWTYDVAQWIRDNYQVECMVSNISLGGNNSYAGFVSEKLLHDDMLYDLVILCYGQNDKTTAFKKDYEALVRESLERNQTNCIISILESAQREYNEKMQWILTVADYYQFPVADTISAFNSSGYSYEALSDDGVHPNTIGQEIYADVIEKIISEEVEKEFIRRNSFLFDALKNRKLFNSDDYTYSFQMPEPIDESVLNYEVFRYIFADEFDRLNTKEWEIELNNISGVLGIAWARCPQTNRFEIYLDDIKIFEYEDYLSIDYILKKIDRLFDIPMNYNGKLKIVFGTEEGANQFAGVMFTDYEEL